MTTVYFPDNQVVKMALEAKYKNVINSDFTILSIVDDSTVDYDNETILSRNITVTDAKGVTENFDFPLSNGIGDVFEYPVTKDIALIVELELVPVVALEGSEYNHVKNLLIVNNLLNCLAEKRKSQLHTCDAMCDQRTFEEIEVIDSLYQTAKNLISSDILGTQEALDAGNKLCNAKTCSGCRK